MMPLSRQKQGLGGNSSIAYKRWEPLNENDNDDNGDSLENEPDDTGQVCIMLLKKVLINQKTEFKQYLIYFDQQIGTISPI